ncbi:MAG: SMP-30/gluconolactonase/LRE family protein [Nitrospirae bacterium]|nr:SMP-30/gluconolactonase/LRE family protein [Nitrospirota bacterium]
MVVRVHYKVSLGFSLVVGLALGCIAVTEKTNQTISPNLKTTRPGIRYSTTIAGSTITTIAGGGVGDGGLATEANLYTPQAIALDPEGNLYISDTGHHRIRRVDVKTGIITTVAGTGTRGNIGDHRSALRARLSSPHGLAFDSNGNLYISDTENERIRMLDKQGNIHPVVGRKAALSANPLLSKSLQEHDHSKMYMPGKESEEIELAPPHHMAIDLKGNIYITEMGSNRILKMDMTTGKLIVIAGVITAPGYAGDGGPASRASTMNPHSVAVDAEGNVYIADTLNNRIRKVEAETGKITTIAGNETIDFAGDGGPATKASLAFPAGIAVGSDGTLYFADSGNRVIRKITPTGMISTIAGQAGRTGFSGDGGPAARATLDFPIGVAVDAAGALYLSDSGSQRIRKISPAGIITTVAGNGSCCFSGEGLVAANADFALPYDITADRSGNLYIADRDSHRVLRVDGKNGMMTTVAGNGILGYSGDDGPALKASLAHPMGVARGQDGSIFIADQGNHRIRKVDVVTGIIRTVAGNGTQGLTGDGGPAAEARLNSPTGIAVDAEGNLYVSDTGNQRVRVVDSSTGLISAFAGTGISGFSGDGGPATRADLANPTSLAFDSEGDLYIADSDNDRVRKVDKKTGMITTVAGDGNSGLQGDGGPAVEASLRYPAGIGIDQDILYIADTGHHLIRVVSLKTGIIASVAGSGRPGRGGDGGSATKAFLSSPHGIALDLKSIYIADTDNHLIRKVALGSSPTP